MADAPTSPLPSRTRAEPVAETRTEPAWPGPPRALEDAQDLRPDEILNPEGSAPILLLCDHAGRQIPSWLGDLGLSEPERARHIAYDIGADTITRALVRRLDAPAVLCHVSRLVIDPNREPGEPTSIPRVSDGTVIPGNQHVDADEQRRRLRASFIPYHRAVARTLGQLRRRIRWPVVIAVHTCTEVMGGVWRPWQIGVLWNTDTRLARPVVQELERDPGLTIGRNQPYSGRLHGGYTIPFHAERTRLAHLTFEVRQDLVDTTARAEAWAERLADVLKAPLANPALYRPAEGHPAGR